MSNSHISNGFGETGATRPEGRRRASSVSPRTRWLRQVVISQDEVDALFRDITLLVDLQSVRRRGIEDRDESETSLEDARETLRSSSRDAIQLRYIHDGRDWIDTLLREGEGVQLTRIAVMAEGNP